MTIEQQGYVEIQPQYQHVGYVSATTSDGYFGWHVGASLGLLGAALLTGTATVVLARRMRASATRAALMLLGALGAACCMAAGLRAVPALAPEYHTTLRNMEEACALTEQWAAELGRLPTPAEWKQRMAGRACARDGWGRALGYGLAPDDVELRDQQRYVVLARGARPDAEGYLRWDVRSPDLGGDGVFGTDDDAGFLDAPWGDWKIPGRYAHGRTPRGATP